MSVQVKHRSPAAIALAERKARSRNYIRSLPPEEKVRLLINLNEQYYSMLELRERSGGKPIPARWRKWREARDRYAETRTK
jgi:hypothetical protein